MSVDVCGDVDGLCMEIQYGAAVVVVACDALPADGLDRLHAVLRVQDSWSDLPLILLTDPDFEDPQARGSSGAGNALPRPVVLRRPIDVRNLVRVVELAARARSGQYAQQVEQSRHAESTSRLRGRASRLGARIREQSESLRLMRDVATAANFAESVEEALSFALAQVCRHTGWAFGHAYLPAADDPEVLVPVDASYEHAPGRFQLLRAPTLTIRLARGEGLPGRVYMSGQPEWTRGVEQALDLARAELAQRLGVQTVVAFPILVGAEVVGVLEFLSEGADDPPPELLEAMASVGTQLGRVVERDRLDRALRESARFIESIANTSPNLIRVFDTAAQRYTFVNKQTAAFLGTTVGEMINKPFEVFETAVHPDDLPRLHAAKNTVQGGETQSPITWQVRVRHANGEWRWLRNWSVPFSLSGEDATQCILTISIDVTDETVAEERLRQTERLTSIGTLAAGIAHEVNNPLASVVMTAQLLRRHNRDPKTDEMLANLIDDARRCGRIVRNVQRFARQEPSERRALDLNTVIRAAEELTRTELRHAGIRTQLDLREDLPPIAGDPTELEQVVVNLLTNAAHASERGRPISVGSTVRDGLVQLTVSDEGHGMPPEVVRRAFDPFYTTRGREGGTGLGLSIAHGIIEDHGGTIDIDSRVGRGTRITIRLPAENSQ